MKIFVEHDSHGNIHAVGVPVGGSGVTILRPTGVNQVSEVDAPFVNDENDYENLRKIKSEYNVKRHSGKSILEEKRH